MNLFLMNTVSIEYDILSIVEIIQKFCLSDITG